MGSAGADTGTKYKFKDDGYGTRWLVLEDHDFVDLASTIHLVGEEITEHGYGDRLLAAVFTLEFVGKKAYWIYNIKRGTFHPFIPHGENDRDNKNEIRMSSIMENQNIPVEPKLEHWYALRGIPI